MTDPRPVPTQSLSGTLPNTPNTPKPTQGPSKPEIQAAIGQPEPSQTRASEATAMLAPGYIPAVADSTQPPPPVELRQFAEAASEFLAPSICKGN